MAKKFNFTKAEIDALPLPQKGKRDTYHDTKVSGLHLRISSTGIKTFSVFKRIKGGNPERITLGRHPDMTIDQARRKTMEINLVIAEGKSPAEAKRKLKSEFFFSDLFTEYLERHSKPKKKTWADDLDNYKNHVEKQLSKKKVVRNKSGNSIATS